MVRDESRLFERGSDKVSIDRPSIPRIRAGSRRPNDEVIPIALVLAIHAVAGGQTGVVADLESELASLLRC